MGQSIWQQLGIKVRMDEPTTEQILRLQQRLTTRLAEFGYADLNSATRTARHMAEIAVLGERLATVTLPLFLSLNRENHAAANQVVLAIKLELDEIRDALLDVEPELQEIASFFDLQQ